MNADKCPCCGGFARLKRPPTGHADALREGRPRGCGFGALGLVRDLVPHGGEYHFVLFLAVTISFRLRL